MGVGVSGWLLARTVASLGQLGVVSGTALAVVLARQLQLGDPEGHLRRALSHLPVPGAADRILGQHYIPGGKQEGRPFKLTSVPTLKPSQSLVELTVAANFVEVFLAKEAHSGLVGINYLEKIQLPTLPSIYGAMLAGVNYILMGAGIPRSIPGVLDRFSRGEQAELRIDVAGAGPGQEHYSVFNPQELFPGGAPILTRPNFLGIVSSSTLAMTLAKKASGRVEGFIVEGPTAGGHNAPPRGTPPLSSEGEPVYGPRDVPELEKIKALGLPFWLAGSYGRAGKLAEAIGLGATGIQVGTAFAFCEESGVSPDLKRQVLQMAREKTARIFTDPLASPTGFPFKVAQMDRTLSDSSLYQERERICDLGYLRQLYLKPDNSIGYRCPAEPVEDYVRKGGLPEDTVGRKCICNGLPATIGLGQNQNNGTMELPLVTGGDDLVNLADYLTSGSNSYSAKDVLIKLLG